MAHSQGEKYLSVPNILSYKYRLGMGFTKAGAMERRLKFDRESFGMEKV